MKAKGKRDADGSGGGKARGARKNALGSDSQGLMQAAAGTGFIGFSAFQSQSSTSVPVGVGASGSPKQTIAGKAEAGHGRGRGHGGKAAKAMGGQRGNIGAGQVLPPHYSGSDSHLAVVSRRLSKRDVTTKLKALAELRTMCRLVTPDSNSKPAPQPSDLQTNGQPNPRVPLGSPRVPPGVDDTARVALSKTSLETHATSTLTPSAEALGGFAPHWVFLYQRLSTEGDRRTREAANSTLLCMMKANRRSFQPLLLSLLGPWCCSQADTAGEVSRAAKEAFEAVFPETKRQAVLGRCAEGVLRHADAMLQQTPATLEEASGCTQEEAEKRAERLTVSALSALANFMEAVGSETNEKLCRVACDEITPAEDPGEVAQETAYWSVIDEDLWDRLQDSRPAVRRATYALVSSCCRQTPGLLHPRPRPLTASGTIVDEPDQRGNVGRDGGTETSERRGANVVGETVEMSRAKRSRWAAPALVVKLLSDKEVSNHGQAWQAALLVMKEFKENWAAEQDAHAVLPALLTGLRKGKFLESSRTSYPCLLPLLATLHVDTLLLPSEARTVPSSWGPNTSFSVEFLEAIWAPVDGFLSRMAGGEGQGLKASWLVDVTSAHVECVAFLLLKLPTSGADFDPNDERFGAAASFVATSAMTALANATRYFVLDRVDDAVKGDVTGRGKGLRNVLRSEAERSTVRDAFGRALGQLHLGVERGAGVMGEKGRSGLVWGALLDECARSLALRSEDGVRWMSDILVYAIAAVIDRHAADDKSRRSTDDADSTERAARGAGTGGVFDLCRTVFGRCVECIGSVDAPREGGSVAERQFPAAVSHRDSALVSCMARLARALGLRDCLRAVNSNVSSTPALSAASDSRADKTNVPDIYDEDGRKFFDTFLVPRFAATAALGSISALDGGRSRRNFPETRQPTAVSGLVELVQMHLAESDRRDESFKLLVQNALAQPPSSRLLTTTMTLRLVPDGFSGSIPEVEDAALTACGLASEGSSLPSQFSADLPLFLQASLGVWDGRAIASPFVGSSVAAQIVNSVTTTAGSEPTAEGEVSHAPPGSPASPTPNHEVMRSALEGLLGVLAVKASLFGSEVTERTTHDGTDAVEAGWLDLLLATFRGCGTGDAADRLWHVSGEPALLRLVHASKPGISRRTDGTTPTMGLDERWEAFVTAAVEFTRWVMEGDQEGDDVVGNENDGDFGMRQSAERAATLILILTELEQQLSPQSYSINSTTGGGSAPCVPVLWRLGLTQPEVWQRRRTEAIARMANITSATKVDLARSCASSRWGRRWYCLLKVLNRLPSARARLLFIAAGVHSGSAVRDTGGGFANKLAGVAVQEAITAGMVVFSAVRLLVGESDDLVITVAGGCPVNGRDLPPGLLSSTSIAGAVPGSGGRGSTGNADSASTSLNDFGVGFPCWRGWSTTEMPTAAIAAGVMDAALTHLSPSGIWTGSHAFRKSLDAPLASGVDEEKRKDNEGAVNLARGALTRGEARAATSETSPVQHPFKLLLPTDLWPVAFEISRADKSVCDDDVRLHDMLVSAVSSAASAMAANVTALGIHGDEAGAWWLSCAAEVTAGLMKSVLGEVFSLGLGLGAEACRMMAIQCGTYQPPTLSAADVIPGAKTLYTREGQAVTLVAVHDDDSGGEPYYTIRPQVAAAGSNKPTWQERQTVLNRLFLSPPDAGSTGSAASVSCPWFVKPSVSRALADVLQGPLFAIENGLRRLYGLSSPGGADATSPALTAAAAATLRGCASTCVRASLLCATKTAFASEEYDVGAAGGCSDGGGVNGSAGVWEIVGPKITELRNRWASVAAKSQATPLITGAGDRGDEDAALAVSLSTAVLSGFLAGTPLIPSDENAMSVLPEKLNKALSCEADNAARKAGDDTGSDRRKPSVPGYGWKRTQALSALLWLRDASDASCKVHLCPSTGSIEGMQFRSVQAATDSAVLSSVRASRQSGWGGGALDLALVRAAAGLFCPAAALVSRGKESGLSSVSTSTVVSWAVSKFLLTGSRITASATTHSADASSKNDFALCFECARLLTAIAWDGRRGWGGDGSHVFSAPARALVAGPEERSQVWAAARAPAVWSGLHAAVVGAAHSPTIQMCAFEVLEAAAAGWDCGGDSGESEERKEEVAEGASAADENAGENSASEGDTRGQSVVSRLASALGDWGLAAVRQSAVAGSDGADGMADVDVVSSTAEIGGNSAGANAAQEEAQEQQEDLELIARCFPEDLLLAVEALPTTIEVLGQEREQRFGRKTYQDDSSDDDDAIDELEQSGDEEIDVHEDHEENLASQNDESAGTEDKKVLPRPEDEIVVSENFENTETEQKSAACDGDAPQEEHSDYPIKRQTSGRSKNRRLRRQRSETASNRGSDSNFPVSRRARRDPANGPSLTAPFLTWLLWLEHCRRASEAERRSRAAARAFVVRAGALAPVLEACFRVLKSSQVIGGRGNTAATKLGPAQAVRISRLDPTQPLDLARLALAVYFRTVHVFPALTRSWWADDCARGLRIWAAEFTQKHVSPALIQIEAEIIADATSRGIWDEGGEMTVRASANSRQVVASYIKEECTLEACIQLPPEYPLRSVDVTCTRRMGVSESRWRQWVLQIVTLLSLQDGSVLDAVMLWKKNVDKEFEGVEPCVICYGILHPRDMALPQMSCKTCKNRFHSTCLYKWFHTSHKSKCPICQQGWA